MRNLYSALLVALSFGTVPLSYSQNPILVDPTAAECANPGWDARAQVYLPQCSPYALGSYPGNRCYVTIDRAAPTSPQTITLPPGTHTCLALHNPRPTEGVQFQPTISNIPAPDLGSSFLPNLSPLQSLGFIAGQVSQPGGAAAGGGSLLTEKLQPNALTPELGQPGFENLTPAQRLEALSVVGSSPPPITFSASEMLVVETSDTTNTSALATIVGNLQNPAKEKLQRASNAVSMAHELQALKVDQRQRIAANFYAAVVQAYTRNDPKALPDAKQDATSLSALLGADNVNAMALATELFVMGKDHNLLEALRNIVTQSKPTPPPPPAKTPPSFDDIRGTLYPQISTLDSQVTTATSAIVRAGNLATCFLQYNAIAPNTSNPNNSDLIQFNGEAGNPSRVITCSPQTLNSQGDGLRATLQPIYDDINVASDMGLLQGSFTKLNTIVTDGLKQCAQTKDEPSLGISPSPAGGGGSKPDPSKVKDLTSDDCAALAFANDSLISIQSRITLLSSLQGPLQQAKIQLERLPQQMSDIIYELPINGKFQKGYTSASVAVVVQPLVSLTTSPTTSTIATVPITFGAGRYRTFATSTGVAFLMGKAANYSLQQQATASTTGTSTPGSLCSGIATGPAATTSTYCVVNSPSSSPQILAPAVYLHYLLFGAKRAPFQVGVHLSGGVGLDLSPVNKSATFMAGASLQLGSVMITPAVTFFEDQRLAGGYTPQQLYTTTGTVPTNIVWPKKFSIGITYVIPALSSASPASPSSSPSSNSSNSNSGSSGAPKKSH